MKGVLTIFIFIISLPLFAQQTKEEHRNAGYQAMEAGKLKKAIREYSAVLQQNPKDYDARLALGRLYYRTGNCDSSLYYYRMIYRNDSTDVEALNGFTKCFLRRGKLDTAIQTAGRAVDLLPEHVPEYLLLARALRYDGQIDKAIEVYHKANKQDSTYSEVWAGLGKMYYWKSQPVTAQKYYRKALSLDPENKGIRQDYKNVRDALKYHVNGKFQYIQEKEKTYRIDALVQRYSFRKRLTNNFQLSADFLLDHSNRDFTNDDPRDTTRWFDNTWLKASWITEHHHLSVYGGVSISDDKMSTYGLSWNYKTSFGNFTLENTLDAGYHYFYYWNEVGRHAISEKIKLEYSGLSLNLDLGIGSADEKPVREYKSEATKPGTNPYLSYRVNLNYKILENPDIKLGIDHSYYNYKYTSPDYYTPNDRLLTGPSASIYHSIKKFYFYARYSYNAGTEKYYYLKTVSTGNGQGNSSEEEVSGTIEADNWSTSVEAGYNFDNLSLSAGANRFYNPYYQSFIGFISLSGKI